MIIFCEKLMPRVLKVFCDSNWNVNIDIHIDDSLNQLKNIMERTEYRFIWLWIINENIPSFSVIVKIVSKLVYLYNQMSVSIDFNIVYCSNQDTLNLVERVLSLYKPVSEVKIARSKEDIVRLINENNN